MKRSFIGITLAMVALVAVITSVVRADPLPGEVLKFYQTPLNNVLLLLPPGGTLTAGGAPAPWPGHDELSTAYLTNGNQYIGQYMADDFCDFQSTPIVHVMWWGSYINNYRGSNGVTKFLITFETDVAAGATNNQFGYSHPGTIISSQIVTLGPLAPGSGTYTETLKPLGGGPVTSPDGNLYQYNAELAVPVTETSNEVEWIKIVALTDDQQLMWGWHDRDYGVQDPLACVAPAVAPGEINLTQAGPPTWHFQDDAVTGAISIQGTNVQQNTYTPTFYLLQYDGINSSKDLAFALYTKPPLLPPPCEVIKFYQVPLNDGAPVIPPGGTIPPGSVPTAFPGHDEVSTAYYNADGNFYSGMFMADDFCDQQSTPILHVTWWGSYMHSNYYGGGVQQFLIAFESDVAVGATNNQFAFSHPGNVILSQTVSRGPLGAASGTFIETAIPLGTNGPASPDGNLYQYDAELALPAPESSNQVEWIKIVALTTDTNLVWGWHDRDYGIQDPLACMAPSVLPGEFNANPPGPPIWHFQDDAITGGMFLFGGTNVLQNGYSPTSYVLPFDGISSSKDLAFALYTSVTNLTYEEWQLKYFGCTNCLQAAGTIDFDGDGMVNTDEFRSGTNPTNSLSYLRIASITRVGVASNDIKIVWSAEPCKEYVVESFPGNPPDGSYSNNFTIVPGSLTIIPSPGGPTFTNYTLVGAATNKPSRYFRVRLFP